MDREHPARCPLQIHSLGVHCVAPAGTLRQLPLVAEQVVEVIVVPLHRVGCPCAFQAAGDRIGAFAAAKAALPAQALLLDAGSLGFGTDVAGPDRSTMGFAKRVSAGNERNRLLVIHRHAAERLSNVPWLQRVDLGFRSAPADSRRSGPSDGAERHLEIPVAGVALVFKPFVSSCPQ